ncbi:MAG: hypothetical protein ACRD29_01590 [Acidimicrobiales bacterium]
METRRWVNQTLPQTLQIAMWLLYLEAVFTLLFSDQLFYVYIVVPFDNVVRLVMTAALAAGGFGIANEKKWGYRLAMGAAATPLVARVLAGIGISLHLNLSGGISPLEFNTIGLLFEIALLALLLHPHSREHQRIWFK